MGLNKVHCFGFLGVFAVVSGIVAFSAYDSLYSYIMKMVSNWNNIFTMNMNDDIFTKNSSQNLYGYIMKMVSNWELKHSPHMNDDDRSTKSSSQSLISELNIFWNLNLNVFIALIHL